MKGTISKKVVTTMLEVTRYNEETKMEEVVTENFVTLRTPSYERIENHLMEDKGYLSFKVISTEEEVYTMSVEDFINNAMKKER